MLLSHLEITDFRNINHVKIDLDKNFNIFIGKNGSGKTSLLEAIYHFKVKNIDDSFKALAEAKNISKGDYTWALSKGFLHAYEGNLEKAYHFYKMAFRERIGINSHIQSEIFITDVLKQEPSKYQLHYCLGLLYYFLHKDF